MINEHINDDVTVISNSTGEVIYEGSNIIIQDMEHKKKVKDAIIKKNEQYLLTDSLCGNFYWLLYSKNIDKPFNIDVAPANMVRAIYLCTFMDYDNILKTKKKNVLKKSDIQEKLKLGKTAFYEFWNECIDAKIFTETDDGIVVNNNMFFVGKLGKKTDNNVAIKMFKAAIRTMYENTVPKCHKNLAYLFMLIPFLNLKYNIICDNPFETDKSKINRLSVGDICEKFGIDRRHQSRLTKALLKTSIMCSDGHTRSAVGALIDVKDDKMRYRVVVNPMLYSAYINDDNIKYLTNCLEDVDNANFSIMNMFD